MEKLKRNTLSLKTKIKILEEMKSGKTRSEITKKFNIASSTLSKILKKSEEINQKSYICRNLEQKRARKSKYETLNKSMSMWFNQMMETNARVTGPVIFEKAQQFAIKLGIPDFKPSPGWLQRWKKNENIHFRKHHGEAASADSQSAEEFKQNVLPLLLQKYALEDIYNADETGLFYKALPTGSYVAGSQASSGFKTPKERITLLFITNCIGTNKYVYAIGKYKNPRCFRGKIIPIPYKFNKKAWMTSTIWREIIKELDDKFTIKNKKILLLIDNASCHKLDFEPKSIEIVFMPPCTTSLIQPLDQGMLYLPILVHTKYFFLFLYVTGIIQSFKSHYRKCLVREQILAAEGGIMAKFLKSISILRALYIIKRTWWLVTPQTIQNCFKKAGIHDGIHVADSLDDINSSDVQVYCETDGFASDDVCETVDYETFFKNIVDLEKENCFGAANEDDIINEIQEDEIEENSADSAMQPSREEALHALFILKQYLNDNDNIINIEQILFNERDKSLVQKKKN